MLNNTAGTSTRYAEIDFFRGAALLLIFWNHLHWFSGIGVLVRYGFSDAAAMFVFLSGYVSGLVYGKTYLTQGFNGLLKKAWRRAGQIYIAHIVCIIILLFLATFLPPLSPQSRLHEFFNTVASSPYELTLKIISLQYFPALFDILPLYIVMMVSVPAVIVAIKKDWRIFFTLSLILYCAVQVIPALDVRIYYPSWTLNPLSWFFLFTTAMIISIKNREGTLRIPLKRSYAATAAVLLVYSFIDLKTMSSLFQNAGILSGFALSLFPTPFPFIKKDLLQPFYLLHFFWLAYAVSFIAPAVRQRCSSRFAKPFVLCGQHSLPLFSVGIVAVYLFTYIILLTENNPLSFYFFALLGCAATLFAGYFLSARTRRRTQQRTEPQLSVSYHNKIIQNKTLKPLED